MVSFPAMNQDPVEIRDPQVSPVDFILVIPVYNESCDIVRRTIASVHSVFAELPLKRFRIIVVDDGSEASYGLSSLQDEGNLHVLRHTHNRGYGAAIKSAILAFPAEYIGICDADGTYPVEDFPELLKDIHLYDMVIGTRTGAIRQIPFARRFPKRMLNLFASYFADTRIVDLNSGMRVFRRDLAFYLWGLIPNGFSLTSTLTMGSQLGGFRVREVPINYFQREGKSAIRPIRDTQRFFRLVVRLGLLFAPKRLFSPIAASLFFAGLGKAILRDLPLGGYIGNLAAMLMIAGLQVYLMGLLAQILTLNRNISSPHDKR